MSKQKKIFFLVFTFLIIIDLLFLPCERYYLAYSGARFDQRCRILPPFFISGVIKYRRYAKWELSIPRSSIKQNFDAKNYNLELFLANFFNEERQLEFKKQFGDNPHYYKLRIERLATELTTIILSAGFIYILIFLILKKGNGREKSNKANP